MSLDDLRRLAAYQTLFDLHGLPESEGKGRSLFKDMVLRQDKWLRG